MSKPKPITYVAHFTLPKPRTVETDSIRPITHAWRIWWRDFFGAHVEHGFSPSAEKARLRIKAWSANHKNVKSEIVETERKVQP